MRTVSVRELRTLIPHLEESLAREGELVLVNRGKPIARLVSVAPPSPRRLPSLKAWREELPPVPKGHTEKLLREERNRR